MSLYQDKLEFVYHPLKRIYEIFVVIISFLYSVCFFIFGSLFSSFDFIWLFLGLGFLSASVFIGINCLKKENKIVVTKKNITREIVTQSNYKVMKIISTNMNRKWDVLLKDGYLLYMLLIPLLFILIPFICMITFVRYCLPKSSLKKLQIDDVIDVQYKQSIYGKIFNYGTIIFVWKNKKRCFLMIQNPQKVCEEIKFFFKI